MGGGGFPVSRLRLWGEHSSTLVTFPAPTTSNGAGGFPAPRFPESFTVRVTGPLELAALSDIAPKANAAGHTNSWRHQRPFRLASSGVRDPPARTHAHATCTMQHAVRGR